MNALQVEYPDTQGKRDEGSIVQGWLDLGYAVELDKFLDRKKKIDHTLTRYNSNPLRHRLEWQFSHRLDDAAKLHDFITEQQRRANGAIKIFFAAASSIPAHAAVALAHRMVQETLIDFGVANAIMLLSAPSLSKAQWLDPAVHVAQLRSRPLPITRKEGTILKIAHRKGWMIIKNGQSNYYATFGAVMDSEFVDRLRSGKVLIGASVTFLPTRNLSPSPHFHAVDVQPAPVRW